VQESAIVSFGAVLGKNAKNLDRLPEGGVRSIVR
jgi:hypothetical protein